MIGERAITPYNPHELISPLGSERQSLIPRAYARSTAEKACVIWMGADPKALEKSTRCLRFGTMGMISEGGGNSAKTIGAPQK
jgi:hypothetical protein